MRYKVCCVDCGVNGAWIVGAIFFSTNDLEEAKRGAIEIGNATLLGGCIWDTVTNTTDWGDKVTPGKVRV